MKASDFHSEIIEEIFSFFSMQVLEIDYERFDPKLIPLIIMFTIL